MTIKNITFDCIQTGTTEQQIKTIRKRVTAILKNLLYFFFKLIDSLTHFCISIRFTVLFFHQKSIELNVRRVKLRNEKQGVCEMNNVTHNF